ncbi:MAG TPA: glycosyltransferase family 39 protein [Candidatus Tectomicrobia bacterium]
MAPRQLAWCVALLVTSVVLRVGGLGPPSLWRDDAWQALVARTDSWSDIVRIGQTAPGFSLLLWLWLKLTGLSSLAAQALPFVAGIAAAPFAYLLAARAGFGTAGAVSAGVGLAASPLHVVYSTRVKPFTLDSDVSILLLYLSVRVLEEPARRRSWAALLFFAILATLFSASTVPVLLATVAAPAVASIWTRRDAWRPALTSLCALVVFMGVWWLVWLRHAVVAPLKEHWLGRMVPFDEGWGPAAQAVLTRTEALLDGLSPLPIWAGAMLLAFGILVLVRRTPWLALLLLGGPALSLAGGLLHLAPYGGGRSDIYLYPSLCLLLAGLPDEIGRRPGRPATAIGLVLALAPLAIAPRAIRYPPGDVRPIVEMIESETRDGDAVVVYPQLGYIYGLYTRFPVQIADSDVSLTGFTVVVQRPGVTTLILAPHSDVTSSVYYRRGIVQNLSALRSLVNGSQRPQRVWFVERPDGRALPALKSVLLGAGYVTRRSWEWPGVVASVWTNTNALNEVSLRGAKRQSNLAITQTRLVRLPRSPWSLAMTM